MDLKEQIKIIGANVAKLKDSIQTEEATKTAFIMPFIQALGYNVFNPLEVIPEFTADIGIKQGEKVDYAIFKDEKLILLIECKKIGAELNLNNESQLLRYFHVSNAKFAILTNGESYKFYSDIEQENKMDTTPFLSFNITKIKENQILELRKFCKENFDFDKILDTATTLKYSNSIREAIKTELSEPSDEFLAVFIKRAYNGRITKKVLEQFNSIVKYSLKQFIDDSITERLQNAIKAEAEQQTPPP
ncbi:type I restriction endonuclease [Campylobacter sp. JMF_01 NE2]|uniref:type I restriction endonuclease n=1 Tax=unclassified Campylobacter TaxID=2593542 RepID=UPI0022E9D790|nr:MULTISPECIES: type I restriction endonuclease [unclassified Campylobacter]MDA3052253.1 type I restriction endonuclease [Campylobacter sp. JMF_03 NE3]MDA3066587.1 type I restriction endonuclease [Campylobacter sp. JMF_01 NE2]